MTKEMHALVAPGQLLIDWQTLNAAFALPSFEGACRASCCTLLCTCCPHPIKTGTLAPSSAPQ